MLSGTLFDIPGLCAGGYAYRQDDHFWMLMLATGSRAWDTSVGFLGIVSATWIAIGSAFLLERTLFLVSAHRIVNRNMKSVQCTSPEPFPVVIGSNLWHGTPC